MHARALACSVVFVSHILRTYVAVGHISRLADPTCARIVRRAVAPWGMFTVTDVGRFGETRMAETYTITDIASLLGVPVHRVRYAVLAYRIEPVRKVGNVRIWTKSQLPLIRASLETAAANAGQRGLVASVAAQASREPVTQGGREA